MKYKIGRSYAPHLNKSSRLIKANLSLEEAQEWCKDPKTKEPGVWFDFYEEDT